MPVGKGITSIARLHYKRSAALRAKIFTTVSCESIEYDDVVYFILE